MQSKNTYRSQSNYYMSGSSAVLPEYYDNTLYESNNTATETVKKKKIKYALGENIKILAVLFVLATLVVGQYVYIAGLGYNIVREQNNLNAVLGSNEKLKQEYANLNDLSTIENYAVNNLGMVKATASMAYVASSEDTAEAAEDGAEEKENGVLKNIISGVMGIFTSY